MLYLSQIVGKKIYDPQGNRLARVRDLVAELTPTVQLADEADSAVHAALVDEADEAGERDVPVIKGVLASTGRKHEPFYLSMSQIVSIGPDGVKLRSALIDLQPFKRRAGELLLARDLWDKQVIDLENRKVMRVNDIELIQSLDVGAADRGRQSAGSEGAEGAPRWYVRGVDVGFGGIVRRLRAARLVHALTHKPIRPHIVRWRHLDVFGSNVPGGVALQHKKLARLHPVEIARITDSVSYLQGAEIIASLNDALAAETLEEITAVRQTDIVEQIPDARAADILEEMAPDEASDLLAELPEEKAGALLEQMDQEEAQPIRRLMRYSESSAGGIMTTDYMRVLPYMTVGEVIESNKPVFMSADLIYYMFVVDKLETNELVGVITVRDLLVQDRDCPVESFMLKEYLTARPGEDKKEVARKMAEYNLLALPVVDHAGVLHGVVTVDDALDSLLPEGWQKRLPKIFS